MENIANFFTLQPTFTITGLRIIWYVYLLNAIIQLYVAISGIINLFAQRGVTIELWSPNFIPLILGAIAQVLLVRLLLEVAAFIISRSKNAAT